MAIQQPKLQSEQEIMSSIAPLRDDFPAVPLTSESFRRSFFDKDQRLLNKPQHMARLINLALADIMLQYDNSVICGEDVGKNGGVYGVTTGLYKKFGAQRVIDTLLDEQSILGLSLGLAHNGYLAIPEIQFLAYVHNAEDQIRGEAATLSFFSNAQYTNPMLIRIPGLAYQKGFGGHFHNDNSLAVFRDIPGLVIACPSNGADAVQMLRTCMALAHEQRRVVVFIEPIALYMIRDLHDMDDNLWSSVYQPPGQGEPIGMGQFAVWNKGSDICILTYGNGYYLSRQAAKILHEQHGVRLRIIDLRWLAPLDEQRLVAEIAPCEKVLIVDECRRTGSLSEALVTLLVEHSPTQHHIARVTAQDSFVPLANAANIVLPHKRQIVKEALALLRVRKESKQHKDLA